MSTHGANPAEAPADWDIVNTRVLDAPRARVFDALTDPRHLVRWWGPKGFTNTFHEFDPRPGGRWRFVMHGPDGRDYQNESVFIEVVRPERVVFRHLSDHLFQMTISLAERGETTQITWRMRFDTAAEADKIRPYVLERNEENLDRLEAELATMR